MEDDFVELKNTLQLYGNIQRLEALNKRIKKAKNSTFDMNEIVDDIILYHETIEKIIKVYESVLFSGNISEEH